MTDKPKIVVPAKAKDNSVEEMFKSMFLMQVLNLPLDEAKALAEEFGLTAENDDEGNLVITLQNGTPLIKLEK